MPQTTPRGVRVRYETIELGGLDIHVRTLRDRQQYEVKGGSAEDSANWSVFGVVWESARALAGMMVDYDVGGRRVLEIGCGIGLSSLVLQSRGLDITATDRHDRADEFLRHNADINGLPPIPFAQLEWDPTDDERGPGIGRFDLIIASDVLYERGHAGSVSAFIATHAGPDCEVLLIDPGRHHCGRYDRCMRALEFSSSAIGRHELPAGSSRRIRGLRHARVGGARFRAAARDRT